MFDRLDDAAFLLDPDGAVLALNPAGERKLGWAGAEIVGRPLGELLDEAAAGRLRKALQRGGGFVPAVVRTKSGAELGGRLSLTRLRSPDDAPAGWLATAHEGASAGDDDSEPLSESGEKLSLQKQLLKPVTEASLDGVLVVSTDERILFYNRRFLELWNMPESVVVEGRNDDAIRFVSPLLRDPDRFLDGVRELTQNPDQQGQEDLALKDGRTFHRFSTPIRGEDGRVFGRVVYLRDITAQKRLEEDLRRLHDYTRGLIESSVDPMLTVGPDFAITDVNEQTVRLVGVARDRLIGSRFPDYFTEPERAAAGIRKTFDEGSVTNYDLSLRTAAGRTVLVSFNASVFKDASGTIRGIFAVARDITEQRRLEDQLRQSAESLQNLFDAVAEGIAVTERGIIVNINPALAAMVGYDRSEVIGRPVLEFMAPECHESLVRNMLSGHEQPYECIGIRKDGTPRHMEVLGRSYVLNGRPARVTTVRDITARKEAEEALRRSEERTREQQAYTRGLIESSVDPMLTVDRDLSITDVNEQMIRLAGSTRERLVGSSFLEYFTEPDKAAAGVYRTFEQGYVTNYELTLKTPGGRTTLVSFNASVFKDAAGNVRGIFAVARDITEQRHMEQQMRLQKSLLEAQSEASLDGILVTSNDGRIHSCNRRFLDQWGIPESTIEGMPMFEALELVLHKIEDPDPFVAAIRYLEEHPTEAATDEIRLKDGRTFERYAAPIADESGRHYGRVLYFRDITERRENERRLREGAESLQNLFDAVSEGILITEGGTIVDVNKALTPLLGYERSEMIGRPATDFVAAESHGLIAENIRAGYHQPYEGVGIHKDGHRIIFEIVGKPYLHKGRTMRVTTVRDISRRREAEEAIRISAQNLKNLFDAMSEGIVITERGIIVDVNKSFVEMNGTDRSRIIGRPALDFIAEESKDLVRANMLSGYEKPYECVGLRNDGSKVSLEVTGKPYVYNGRQARVTTVRDITDRKRTQAALLQSEGRNRAIIETATDAIVTCSLDGIVQSVNPAWETITGWTPAECIGKPWAPLIHPDDMHIAASTEGAIQGEAPPTVELRVRKKSGDYATLEATSRPLMHDGKVIAVLSVARDVTRRNEAQEELRITAANLKTLFDAMSEGIIITEGGTILDVNKSFAEMTGCERSELLGKPAADFVPAASRERVRAKMTSSYEQPYECAGRRRDGTMVNLEITGRSYFYNGRPARVTTVRDITARKQSEEQIRRAAEETRRAYRNLQRLQRQVIRAEKLASVGMVMAGIAHEINNPLNVMYGNLRLLKERLKRGAVCDADNVSQMVADALTAAENAKRVVEEFRHFARDRGEAEAGDLRAVIEEAVALARPLAGGRIAIRCSFGRVPPMRLFHGQIRRAMANLLKNAIEAIDGKGRVDIVLSRRGKNAVITVSDTGRGIDKANLPRVFEPFFSTKEQSRGFGLGLALTQAVVQNHGGDITVRSRVGKGTMFTIRLPLKG